MSKLFRTEVALWHEVDDAREFLPTRETVRGKDSGSSQLLECAKIAVVILLVLMTF